MNTFKKQIRLKTLFLLMALLLLIAEIIIAQYVHDGFVRPFVGDFLATMLLFCTLVLWPGLTLTQAAHWSLALSYALEGLQLIRFLDRTGLAKHKTLVIWLGHSFSWFDMLSYTLAHGCICLFIKNSSFQTHYGSKSA